MSPNFQNGFNTITGGVAGLVSGGILYGVCYDLYQAKIKKSTNSFYFPNDLTKLSFFKLMNPGGYFAGAIGCLVGYTGKPIINLLTDK